MAIIRNDGLCAALVALELAVSIVACSSVIALGCRMVQAAVGVTHESPQHKLAS